MNYFKVFKDNFRCQLGSQMLSLVASRNCKSLVSDYNHGLTGNDFISSWDNLLELGFDLTIGNLFYYFIGLGTNFVFLNCCIIESCGEVFRLAMKASSPGDNCLRFSFAKILRLIDMCEEACLVFVT